jgi:PIN domain nuclease of toxin-antitoxin system
VNLLLDTHVLLWALADDPRLSASSREAIQDGRNRVLVSAASSWEITIKKALGRLRAPDDLEERLVEARLEPLHITVAHTVAVGRLPDLHADPFDRLLVAQTLVEGLTLMTADEKLHAYEVEVLVP